MHKRKSCPIPPEFLQDRLEKDTHANSVDKEQRHPASGHNVPAVEKWGFTGIRLFVPLIHTSFLYLGYIQDSDQV